MTRIAIASASAAVARTLEAIILASGHQLVSGPDAELVLYDGVHPSTLPPAPARILTLATPTTSLPDTVACPVRPSQLQRLLANPSVPTPLQAGGGWALDLLARSLTHAASQPVALTEKECLLLQTLATSYPHALGREALLAQVWGIGRDIDTHTLETHIYRLRSKLGGLTPAAGDIVTETGAYKLALNPPV